MDLKNYSSPSVTVLRVNEQDVLTASEELGVNWGDTWVRDNNQSEQSIFE